MEMMVEGGALSGGRRLLRNGRCGTLHGPGGRTGHHRAGAWADLLVLDADPTVDIMNTREIHSVWISGNRVR
jgi:hypothetical protein